MRSTHAPPYKLCSSTNFPLERLRRGPNPARPLIVEPPTAWDGQRYFFDFALGPCRRRPRSFSFLINRTGGPGVAGGCPQIFAPFGGRPAHSWPGWRGWCTSSLRAVGSGFVFGPCQENLHARMRVKPNQRGSGRPLPGSAIRKKKKKQKKIKKSYGVVIASPYTFAESRKIQLLINSPKKKKK